MSAGICYREAVDLVRRHAPRMRAEPCRLEWASGRVLREEIRVDRPYPPFDRVMMDGYAFRSVELEAGAWRVMGVAAAGEPCIEMPSSTRECVEVMTGAPLPSGARVVVPVEDVEICDEEGTMVRPARWPAPGEFIHRMGSDAGLGEALVTEGECLGGREIGIAASFGYAWLQVSKIPEIAVIPTGSELVPVDQTPKPHQIRQSNGHAIVSALQGFGYHSVLRNTLEDTLCEELLLAAMSDVDWVIVTGAVSKGRRDLIPEMLRSLGCQPVFHGVAQRPGKPAGCWLGPAGQLVMALPGNPVSALTGLHAMVVPGLEASIGLAERSKRWVVPAVPLPSLPGMTRHLPVSIGSDGRARAVLTANSGDFIGLLRSDGFVTLPPAGLEAAYEFTPWR